MIPLVISLWQSASYKGSKRMLVDDTPDLSPQAFDNTATSVQVHQGPDYAAWKAANGGKEPTAVLYENANYGGGFLVLTAGAAIPNLARVYSFDNHVSSARFNPVIHPAGPVGPIPFIVELYQDANFSGNRVVLVENDQDIFAQFGPEFGVTGIKVRKGPNYVAGQKVRLFGNPGFKPPYGPELGPGDYSSLVAYSFNDRLRSIKLS